MATVMIRPLQLPPELLYEVVAEVVTSYIDLAVMTPPADHPESATHSDSDVDPGTADEALSQLHATGGGSKTYPEVTSNRQDGEHIHESIPSGNELTDESESEDNSDEEEDEGSAVGLQLTAQLERDELEDLPPNYIEPLLCTSHAVREITLKVISEALCMKRDDNGKLTNNPWLCIKEARKIRRLTLSEAVLGISDSPVAILLLWKDSSLFGAYGALSTAEMTQLRFAQNPNLANLSLMLYAVEAASEAISSIKKEPINKRVEIRLQMMKTYIPLLAGIGQFKCLLGVSIDEMEGYTDDDDPKVIVETLKATADGIRVFRRKGLSNSSVMETIPENLGEAFNLDETRSSLRAACINLSILSGEANLHADALRDIDKYVRRAMLEMKKAVAAWDDISFAPSYFPLL